MTELLKHIPFSFHSIKDHANQGHKIPQQQLELRLNTYSSSCASKYLLVCTIHKSCAAMKNKNCVETKT